MSLTDRKGQGRFILRMLLSQSMSEGKGETIMKTLEKVSDFVGKYMAAIVIVVAEIGRAHV